MSATVFPVNWSPDIVWLCRLCAGSIGVESNLRSWRESCSRGTFLAAPPPR